eukprot:SAG31_NODE_2364_length_5860_cov_11.314529_3_plen_128_part_00
MQPIRTTAASNVDGATTIEMDKEDWKELGTSGVTASKIISRLKKLVYYSTMCYAITACVISHRIMLANFKILLHVQPESNDLTDISLATNSKVGDAPDTHIFVAGALSQFRTLGFPHNFWALWPTTD